MLSLFSMLSLWENVVNTHRVEPQLTVEATAADPYNIADGEYGARLLPGPAAAGNLEEDRDRRLPDPRRDPPDVRDHVQGPRHRARRPPGRTGPPHRRR